MTDSPWTVLPSYSFGLDYEDAVMVECAHDESVVVFCGSCGAVLIDENGDKA